MSNEERAVVLSLLAVCSILRNQEPGHEDWDLLIHHEGPVQLAAFISDEERDRMANEIAAARDAELSGKEPQS